MTPRHHRQNGSSRIDRPRATARPAAIVLACVMAGGCAVFSQDESSLRAAAPAPEGKRLAELASAAFVMAKLTGTPEVSPVHAAHDAQWGDWMFCIRSNSAADAPKYGVLIGHDAILEVRSLVLIDGCDKETYRPLTTPDKKNKSDGSNGRRQ